MKKLLSYVSMLALLTSCNSEPFDVPDLDSTALIADKEVISIVDNLGLTSLDGSDIWSAKDTLAVELTMNNQFYTVGKLGITDGVGTKDALFDNAAIAKDVRLGSYALLPYHMMQVEDGTAIFTYPDTYRYVKVMDRLDKITDVASLDPTMTMPMAGRILNNQTTLHHLGGVLCIDVEDMSCEAGTITVNMNQTVSGPFALDLEKVGDEDAFLIPIPSDKQRNTLTIHFDNAQLDHHAYFLFPVLAGVYKRMDLKITTTRNGEDVVVLDLPVKREFEIKKQELVEFDVVGISN